jgi:hypothetical protein
MEAAAAGSSGEICMQSIDLMAWVSSVPPSEAKPAENYNFRGIFWLLSRSANYAW